MRLIIYNLETDLNSPVLAAAHHWIEAFAQHVDQVVVYSTHIGRLNLASNVEVHEIGGGTVVKRAVALIRLFVSFFRELPFRKESIVFHHMSPRTLLVLGPLYRLARVNQGLWYSHSKKSFSLRASKYFANKIFSSTPTAIPISGDKLRFVGHGVKSEKFTEALAKSGKSRRGIVALGRISPIKRLEQIIDAISHTRIADMNLTFIGSSKVDDQYEVKLVELARLKDISLKIIGSLPYESIPQKLCEFDAIYTGTPKSVDKAAIEGAICGCFVLTTEEQTLHLTGMKEVFRFLGFEDTPPLSVQITTLANLSAEMQSKMRATLSARAAELNDINETTLKILSALE